MIVIKKLDHLVLTVADLERSSAFYSRVLGMTPQRFVNDGIERFAVAFGMQKFNLHQSGQVIDRNVRHATPGSADVCLITETPMSEAIEHLSACGVSIIEGPVQRTGAVDKLLSVYFYDPDENLIEVSNVSSSASGPSR